MRLMAVLAHSRRSWHAEALIKDSAVPPRASGAGEPWALQIFTGCHNHKVNPSYRRPHSLAIKLYELQVSRFFCKDFQVK